jgi:hypothetical protein
MADRGCVIVGLDPPRQPKRDDTDPAHWAKAMFHRVGPTRHTAVYRAITDSYRVQYRRSIRPPRIESPEGTVTLVSVGDLGGFVG